MTGFVEVFGNRFLVSLVNNVAFVSIDSFPEGLTGFADVNLVGTKSAGDSINYVRSVAVVVTKDMDKFAVGSFNEWGWIYV